MGVIWSAVSKLGFIKTIALLSPGFENIVVIDLGYTVQSNQGNKHLNRKWKDWVFNQCNVTSPFKFLCKVYA